MERIINALKADVDAGLLTADQAVALDRKVLEAVELCGKTGAVLGIVFCPFKAYLPASAARIGRVT